MRNRAETKSGIGEGMPDFKQKVQGKDIRPLRFNGEVSGECITLPANGLKGLKTQLCYLTQIKENI